MLKLIILFKQGINNLTIDIHFATDFSLGLLFRGQATRLVNKAIDTLDGNNVRVGLSNGQLGLDSRLQLKHACFMARATLDGFGYVRHTKTTSTNHGWKERAHSRRESRSGIFATTPIRQQVNPGNRNHNLCDGT